MKINGRHIIIEPWTHETLWGFWKMGIHVAVEFKCPKCKQFLKLRVAESEPSEPLASSGEGEDEAGN